MHNPENDRSIDKQKTTGVPTDHKTSTVTEFLLKVTTPLMDVLGFGFLGSLGCSLALALLSDVLPHHLMILALAILFWVSLPLLFAVGLVAAVSIYCYEKELPRLQSEAQELQKLGLLCEQDIARAETIPQLRALVISARKRAADRNK